MMNFKNPSIIQASLCTYTYFTSTHFTWSNYYYFLTFWLKHLMYGPTAQRSKYFFSLCSYSMTFFHWSLFFKLMSLKKTKQVHSILIANISIIDIYNLSLQFFRNIDTGSSHLQKRLPWIPLKVLPEEVLSRTVSIRLYLPYYPFPLYAEGTSWTFLSIKVNCITNDLNKLVDICQNLW